MNSKKFEQARQYAENRLERELSPTLLYHGIGHTREEVVPAVERLASMEGIRGEARYLLLTAAWFHDLGYVEQPVYHELISQRIAVQVLPTFGYQRNEVEIVRWAILATALPQAPRSLLEAVLADADLDILGRTEFVQRNEDLRQELAFHKKEFTDEQWYVGQLKFLEDHQYFTVSACTLRNPQKLSNISYVNDKLNELRTMK